MCIKCFLVKFTSSDLNGPDRSIGVREVSFLMCIKIFLMCIKFFFDVYKKFLVKFISSDLNGPHRSIYIY